jgi:acyl-CoA reductase-like NAD-dependent aldehyde dehydrogenase
MKEELFGPILPVVPYDTMDEAIAFINARPRPLALYCFSHDGAERDELLRRTHSGGVSVNDWGWHVINHDAPFGGVGNSGMGTLPRRRRAFASCRTPRRCSSASASSRSACSIRRTATSCSGWRCRLFLAVPIPASAARAH